MSTQTISPESTEMVYTVPTQAESLRNARMALSVTKTTKTDIPRKGDFWGMQDESGEWTETGTIKTRPGGSLVAVNVDRTGRTQMFPTNGFKRVGTREWVYSS